MQIIKPLLILCFVALLLAVFRHRARVGLRASARLLSVLAAVAAVVAVADPDIPQAMAEQVGVARGTDLVLYGLVVVFALTTLGLYFRLRQVDVSVQLLARSIAISDAVRQDGPPGAGRGSSGPEPDRPAPPPGGAPARRTDGG